MSIAGVIAITVAIIVAFLTGSVFGYEMCVREVKGAFRDECIRLALKHWREHASHKGCTIFSPEVRKGGIK